MRKKAWTAGLTWETYDQISKDERVWCQRMRLGSSFRLSYGHAFTDWWEKYKDTDRDIFALQADGERRPRKSSHPEFVKMCVSNPKLWELQLAPLRMYAREGAHGLWLNTCENDGSGGFCLCKRCRAWDASPDSASAAPLAEEVSEVDGTKTDAELPENLSDRYARWYNELAVRARAIDSEARVIAYAYSRYRVPPSRLDHIESNVWIGYVGFNAYPRPESYHDAAVQDWLGWSKRGATVFLRTNSLFYFGEGTPYVASREMAEDLQFQVRNGLRATDYDALQGNWATSGPTYYILARMLWDTASDPDALLNEFYEAFGPLKEIVQEYYECWEAFTAALGDNPAFFDLTRQERVLQYPEFYSEAVFREAEDILVSAKPFLSNMPNEERERFENVQLGLEHGKLLVAALADGKISSGKAGERLMAFRRLIAPRNVLNVYWTTSKEMRYKLFE